MDVFFYEAFEEEARSLRQHLQDTGIKAGFTPDTIQEYGAAAPPARIISIRTQSVIPPDWSGELAGILSRSTGYDHLQAYRAHYAADLPCGYLPLYCNRAVAEQALLLWMALMRGLPRQIQQFQNFARDGLTGQECEHKTLLVAGVGNIGHEVARIGLALGMRVLGVDIDRKHAEVNYVTIEEGLSQADVIVCAMNLTDQTRSYFDYDCLKQAKRGAIFVNIARGEISPSADLLQLLNEGYLSGAGLDVYNQESELAVSLRTGQPGTHPEVLAALELANHPHAILTPHNAFNTAESVNRKSAQSIQQLQHFLATNTFLWPVPERKTGTP